MSMELQYAVEEPLTAIAPHNNDLTIEHDPVQTLLLASGLLHNFVTRIDNYAVQQSNGDYYPQNHELTLIDLQKHVAGKTTIGIYPIGKDDKVKFLALDIDVNKEHSGKVQEFLPALQDTARKLLKACDDLGLHALLEFSGRKGYHVILLFAELIPAAQAKQVGRVITSKIGALPDGLHIEIFPKQPDTNRGKGLGNPLKLPFALHKVSGQRSVLLNPADFQPVADPVRVLDEAPRNTLGEVMCVLGDWAPEPVSASTGENGIQLGQPGIQRMVDLCPIIRKFENNPIGWEYDHWLGIASNYIVFEGGWQRFTELCRREPKRFSQDKLDDLYNDIASNWSGPQGYDTFRDQGLDFELPKKGPKAPAGWAQFGRIHQRQPFGKEQVVHVRYDDVLVVKVDGDWRVTDLYELKQDLLQDSDRLEVICPFCGHSDAEAKKNAYHFTYIWCDHCKQKYFEHPEAPGLFAYKGELRRIEIRSDRYISPEAMREEHFRTKEEYKHVLRRVLNDSSRSFCSDDFQIRRIGSVEFDKVSYEFVPVENAIVFKYPPLPVRVRDNAFIDRFLDGMFGEHAEFIRDWMAVYVNTNYVKLPVIALGGSRYAGKNTFAEMVGKIFPKLLGLWDGDVKQFNAQFTNKLLFVDENRNADKPVQYTELKRLTGNDKLPINQKYEPEYIAPNNLNIIIATNEAKPLYLKWGEEPRNEKVNNFFIMKCEEVPEEKIDRELKVKLEDRLGWYVRSELRLRYARIAKTFDPRNRYTLAAPITDFAKGLYGSSKTSVEEEAEILAECIVRGVRPNDVLGASGPRFTPVKHPEKEVKDTFISPRQLMSLISKLKLKASRDMKAHVNALVRLGVISPESDHRTKNVRLGHKILRKREEYPEDGEVVWDE